MELTLTLKIFIWAVPVLFAVTIHEVAHGWVALYFGDKTAKNAGRLSLNPIHHVDPVGTLLVPGLLLWLSSFIFGWAKPVPVQIDQLKNPKRDMGIVAIAGPAANLVMSLFWAFVIQLGIQVSHSDLSTAFILITMGAAGVFINTALMMLNLIPLPPLDGGRILAALLPPKHAYYFIKLERYGLVVLLLFFISGLSTKILWPMMVFGMALSTHIAQIPQKVFTEALALLF